jgi:HEAT repeat protein
MIGRLLITPLIGADDPRRIARTREIARALSMVPIADRYLRSFLWWRRALALRALGLTRATDHTANMVAALDDSNADVRGAALDALADVQNPAALPAIVVRLHDLSQQRGRRAAALAAFGSQCEPFLLELAQVDPEHRLNYARTIAILGTERSRAVLCEWAKDERAEVRTAVFGAFERVGLDERSARLAINALENDDVAVRANAAGALRGWIDAARPLARHLDDHWPVAVQAARSLQSMGEAGRIELESRVARSDLSGTLARQMLWEAEAQR